MQSQPNNAAQALAYAADGLAVLPIYEILPTGECSCGRPNCSSPGKHPRVPHGVKEATKDEATIRQWWHQWPNANIGIATGSASNVFVVDVDIKNNGVAEFERLYNEHGGLDNCRACQTGSGGFHLYFSLPVDQPIPNSAGTIASGIDVRGEGGYVVAPPSNHASGKHYTWSDPKVPISNAPDWLTTLCHKKSNLPADQSDSADLPPAFLSPGRRNTDLASLAGLLRAKGWDGKQIELALIAINNGLAAPLPANELSTIAYGMERYPPHVSLDNMFVSDLLVNAFSGLIRHSNALGWLYFDGHVYRPDDGDKFVTQIAKRTIESFANYAETLNVGGKALYSRKEIHQLKSRAVITSTLKIASSDAQVTASPLDFDADRNLLCLENGTLNLQTQMLHEHRASDMLTHMMPIAYDPSATCPVFDNFLADTLPLDDANFVLRVLAYALTGTGKEQKFVIFHGPGRNGKSTLVNIFRRILGDYAVNAEPGSFLRKQESSASNDIARLSSARFVLTSEFPNGAVLDAPLIKRLTGQDPITARYLYKEHFEYQARFPLLMVTNYMPVIEGSDSAIARRVLAVPFRNIVPPDKIDPNLEQKLWQERSGIFNRFLAALHSYQQLGLAPSPNVLSKTTDFLDDTNLIKRFVEACCEITPDGKCSVSALHRRFWHMCLDEGIKPMSQRSFGQQLEQALGLTKRRVSDGMEWVGIKIRGSL